MAFDAQKALQLASLLGQHAQVFTQNNPGQNSLAQNLVGSAQAGIQAEALKKAKKEEEKKNKGAFGGSIGSMLGAAAGMALAPVTGGASLALAGGLGGALGGAAGTAISGGSPTVSGTLMQGAQGAMQGYQYGKAGELANTVQNGAQSNLGASPAPVAASIDGPAKQVLPKLQSIYPTSQKDMAPTFGSGIANAKPLKGYFGRFANALGQSMGMAQPQVIVNPDGSREFVRGLF